MKTKHALIIGAFVLTGFMCNSIVNAYENHTVRNRGYVMQDRIMEMVPEVVELDGQEVLYLPEINYSNSNINVTYKFYTLVDGELKHLKMN